MIRVLLTIIVLACASLHAQQKPLTKDDIVRMVQQGIPSATIADAIRNAPVVAFTATPDDRAELEKQGVPKQVTDAMVQRLMAYTGTAPFEGRRDRGPQNTIGTNGRLSSEEYGVQAGSVIGEGGGGLAFGSGIGAEPHVEGGVTVGLHRYFGLFAQGGYSRLASGSISCSPGFCLVNAKADLKYFAGGIEAVASNRSRTVPYGKAGYAYTKGGASVTSGNFGVSTSIGVPALEFGGGIRFYLGRKFGVYGDVTAQHFVGPYGGNTIGATTFGFFAQSK